MRLESKILQILDNATITGNVVKLNCGQLDRDTYLAVNKALEYIGGKWNRKLGGHVFQSDPTNLLEQVILSGSVDKPETNKLEYFPTPKKIVEKMLELADIKSGMEVLEPSAGQGAIVDEIWSQKLNCNITIIELESVNRLILEKKGYHIHGDNFLTFYGLKTNYDRIVMNPPFGKQADIDHVLHAYTLLKEGGRLVSVMSAGVTFRDNNKTKKFRELVEDHGFIRELPEDSFKESGTGVNTVLVVLNK